MMGWARGLPTLLLLLLALPSSLNADSVSQASPQRLRSSHQSQSSVPAAVSEPLPASPRGLTTVEDETESESGPALFEHFKLGNRSTAWFIPEAPSDISCLSMFPFGCSGIKDERTCLSSRDGRNTWTEKGLKIRGEPCIWCGGVGCTLGSMSLCEPRDYLLHGEGVAFSAFNAKTYNTVAQCKEGRPVLPDQLPAVNAKAGVGRVMGCGERTYTVPGIMEQYGSCQKFCEAKASVTWPYGQLNWKCGQAWQADGNSCHNLGSKDCLENFTDYMEVGLCRCEMVPWTGKQLIVVGWGQCGGEGYTGPTQCEDGLTCKYRNASYSQCLPDVPLGADCWNDCDERGGWCDWCGLGRACCKRGGYPTDPAECKRVTNWTDTWHHQCVDVPPQQETTLRPTTTAVVLPTIPPIPPIETTTLTSTYTITQTNTTAVPVPVMGWWEWVEGTIWWLLPLLLLLCCLVAGLLYMCMGTTKRKRGKRSTRGKVSMDDSNITSSSRPTETESETSLFDLLDRNHDGIVTMEEFQEAMGGMNSRDATATINTMTVTAVQPVQVVQPMQVVQVTGVQTVASASSTSFSTPLATPVVPPPPLGTQAASFTLPPQMTVSVPTSRVGSAVIPVARPTFVAQQQQDPDLFDLIDQNHDGTITAEEFNRALGTQQVQQLPAPTQTGRVDLYTISPMPLPMQTSRPGSAVVPVASVPMQQMGPGIPLRR